MISAGKELILITLKLYIIVCIMHVYLEVGVMGLDSTEPRHFAVWG